MNRPFTFINSAMSADGKISTKERKQVRISGDIDFDRMDELRASSDAIMVGVGTVLADDPSLTVKSPARRDSRKLAGLDADPIRIIVDSKARTPVDADIFKKGVGLRIVAVSNSAPKDKVAVLSQKATIITTGEDQVDLVLLMDNLSSIGINKLMVEGGATLNWGLISNGLIDEIFSFVGNIVIGGSTSPTLVDGDGFISGDMLSLELKSVEPMEDGILVKWLVANT